MSNPLIPEGSLLGQPKRGNSNVRIAIFTVITIHAVLFVGLLMQGCQRDQDARSQDGDQPEEQAVAADENYIPPMKEEEYFTDYNQLSRQTKPSTNATPAPATPQTNAASEPAPQTQVVTGVEAEYEPVVKPTVPADAMEPVDQGTRTRETAASADRTASQKPAQAASQAARSYKVEKGDSFYSIGKKFGVSHIAIAKANPQVDARRLQVGTELQIPAPQAKTVAQEERNGKDVHVVKAGETLTKIANDHKTTVKAIKVANDLRTDRILAGQKLRVPAGTNTTTN